MANLVVRFRKREQVKNIALCIPAKLFGFKIHLQRFYTPTSYKVVQTAIVEFGARGKSSQGLLVLLLSHDILLLCGGL